MQIFKIYGLFLFPHFLEIISFEGFGMGVKNRHSKSKVVYQKLDYWNNDKGGWSHYLVWLMVDLSAVNPYWYE